MSVGTRRISGFTVTHAAAMIPANSLRQEMILRRSLGVMHARILMKDAFRVADT